jgi:uncharacterized membrane protein YuzA (DUF378 family)
MKLFHVITLLFVVVGGLHFALSAVGINVIGTIFGAGIPHAILHLAIGFSVLYHGIPLLKTHINAV